MDIKKKSELLDDFEQLCQRTPAAQRENNDQLMALKEEIMNRKLNPLEQGRFQGILAINNLA